MLDALIARMAAIRRYRQSPVFHRKGALYSQSFGKDIHRIKNGKVAVIGLPKSGNTWLMSLLADCLDMEFVHPWRREYKDRSGVTMFHNQFSLQVLYKRDLVCAVYIMRDIRDIVVSFYYYSQTDDYRMIMDPSCYFNDIESFYFEYFLSKLVPRYGWVHHAEAYIERGMPLIKYERLYDNPVAELQLLFLRWGIEVAPEKVINAVENNTIDKLKRSGKKLWRQVPTTHFRRGGYGGYVDILTDKVFEDISLRFGDYLRRWGYSLQ